MTKIKILVSYTIIFAASSGWAALFTSKILELTKIGDQMTQSEREISQLQIEKKEMQMTVDKCLKSPDDLDCAKELPQGIQAAQYQIEGIERKLADSRQKLEKLEQDRKELSEKRNAELTPKDKEAMAQEGATVARLTQRNISDRLDILNEKIDLETMGSRIDNHILGQYVAAKIGLTLNSNAICQSFNRCKEPRGTASANNKVTPKQLREIFPGYNDKIFNDVNAQPGDLWKKAKEFRSRTEPVKSSIPTK